MKSHDFWRADGESRRFGKLSRRQLMVMGGLAFGVHALPLRSESVSSLSHNVAAILGTASHRSFLECKAALDALIGGPFQLPDRQLEKLVDAVKQMAGPNPSDRYKIAAIRKTIYESGLWNDNKAFRYDQADPFGINVTNKLLSTYFTTRLGNCVSMPILFLILGERAGLNVSLAAAPLHVFVRYTDPNGQALNIEATSGGNFARDEWYRENLPMTDRAIESGLYMRTLSRQEAVATMATTVMDWLIDKGRFQEAVDVASVILEHSPRDGYTMVKRGHAYGELLREQCIEKYPSRLAMSASAKGQCDNFAARNTEDFLRAEELGWTPEK